MATYKQIIDYIKNKNGIAVQTCCIAEVKEKYKLTRGPAPNRKDPNRRVKYCSLESKQYIAEALRHFDMI